MPFDSTIYSLINQKNMVCEEFLEGRNFTSKSEVVFLEGCGGGSSGESAGSVGGGAGAGCQWFPVKLSIGEVVSVTIGAGGTGSLGNGGATTFGSYLTLPGAVGQLGGANMISTSLSDYRHASPVGMIIKGANGGSGTDGFRSTFSGGAVSGSYGGGGGGFYGAGGNGNNAGAGGAAAANSGAGGGAGSTTGGAGGSGRLRVYYYK